MTAVWELTELNQSETLVALALADHANDKGLCWPSMDRIASKARVSERQARRIVRQLEQIGLITTKMGQGRTNTSRYRFNLKPDTNADTTSPFILNPDMGRREKGTFRAEKPDTAMSAESSLTIKNLQQEALKTPSEEKSLVRAATYLANMRRNVGKGS